MADDFDPLGKLQSLIASIPSFSSFANCTPGSACFKKKHNMKLAKILVDAQQTNLNSPLELSLAEKNFYEYNEGDEGGETIYNNLIIDRFAKTAEELRKNSVEKQQEFMIELSQNLKQYKTDTNALERNKQLLATRQKEQRDLIKNINILDRIVKTNERKVVYEEKDTDGLYTYRRILLFFYYSAIVGYIIFANFIPDKLYMKYSVWLVIIIAAVIPIILNILIKWMFIIGDVVYYWAKEIPHKDVYIDL
jgi:hypothetical protein